ncbi:MAG TPA: FkbM family methyltransferase [Vicinamibacterales bacterium]|nr:FkbM family methyltransferase [Vicinamibacterales bacterium]
MSGRRSAIRTLGAIRRRIFESPEKAAWRTACRQANVTPRFTPGQIKLMDLDVHYADLLTLCPQWDDIFVKRALEFATSSPAPRILDCGANVGLASLFFRRAYPTARITAFEADPALFAVLEANLRANGASGVSARHAAVWTSSGTLTFQCEGADSGMIGSLPGAVDGSPAVVPSLRLRDVLEEEAVDLLKLDIEGAEALVLEDCEPALHRVKALVMDLHEFDASDRQVPRVLALLTRSGFVYSIEEFVPLTWREPKAGADTPFPGRAMQWAMTVRAWRQ